MIGEKSKETMQPCEGKGKSLQVEKYSLLPKNREEGKSPMGAGLPCRWDGTHDFERRLVKRGLQRDTWGAITSILCGGGGYRVAMQKVSGGDSSAGTIGPGGK